MTWIFILCHVTFLVHYLHVYKASRLTITSVKTKLYIPLYYNLRYLFSFDIQCKKFHPRIEEVHSHY